MGVQDFWAVCLFLLQLKAPFGQLVGPWAGKEGWLQLPMSGYNLRGTAGDSRAGGRSEQNGPFTVLSEGESVQTPSTLQQQRIHKAQEDCEHISVTKAKVATLALRCFAQVPRWPWTVPRGM